MNMCIVIDMNVLSCVFAGDNCQHNDYRPVLDWIRKGPGVAVYGGSLYLRELKRARTYLGILTELRRMRRAVLIDTKAVDSEQAIVESIVPAKCDDAHLVAIFRASGCRLLCSNDQRSFVYLKNRAYYCKGQRPPRIYRNRSHLHLLTRTNVVPLRNTA